MNVAWRQPARLSGNATSPRSGESERVKWRNLTALRVHTRVLANNLDAARLCTQYFTRVVVHILVLWSRSNESLLSVANNLMCMYQSLIPMNIYKFMLLGFSFTIVHCCLNNRNPRAWGCSNLSSPKALRALKISKEHISRMKCLVYLEYSNNNHWQGQILTYLSWFIDDLLPIFVAELLWIGNKMHVNNRLLSTATHCCGSIRMRV